jgi:hypothetical protein
MSWSSNTGQDEVDPWYSASEGKKHTIAKENLEQLRYPLLTIAQVESRDISRVIHTNAHSDVKREIAEKDAKNTYCLNF